MDLKERIQELCKSKNISMNQLEQELGFGKGYISKLGKSTPNTAKIQQIAHYLGVTVDYLMTGKDDSQVEGNHPYSGLKGIYLSYAKEAQENGIDPDDIRLALETIRKLRGNK